MALPRASSISSFLVVMIFLATSLMSVVGQLGPWTGALPQDLLAIDLAAKIRSDANATELVSTDFGGLSRAAPAAVFHPSSPHDIAALVHFSYSTSRPFTIASRGHGHSIRGQALAPDGVVIDMASLRHGRTDRIIVHPNDSSLFLYVDAGGEQLWIDVLHAALQHGLAPRSWTDYLYLTVGGTLSNAGVSGQAFRHGPQISNVYELDVVTGKGEMVTCSREHNSELFFAVLGGLGQFGIITRARIALEPAPQRVRWVRLIYDDFGAFTGDQERLIMISSKGAAGFDYVEGSVLLTDRSIINGRWRSSFFAGRDAERIGGLAAQHGVIYCLEGAMYNYDHSVTASTSLAPVDQELELLLEELSFVPGFAFTNDVSYERFLDRVHDGELRLRSLGLWDVPHPWLNIFVPKSRIQDFNTGVFKGLILEDKKSVGPILIYPMNKNKWDERMSPMIPDDEIFYSVGFLWSTATMDDWQHLEDLNLEILRFCDQEGIKYKQYLPHYSSLEDWKKHFGPRWNVFVEMKRKYDPNALLSPGQKIFTSSLARGVHEPFVNLTS